MPRRRNREEITAAYKDFQKRFFDLPDQESEQESSQCAHGACLWTPKRHLVLRATIEAILQTLRGQMLDQPQSRVIAIGSEIEFVQSAS